MTTASVESVEELTLQIFTDMDVNKDERISHDEFLEGASKNDFVIKLLQPDPDS
jgi:hypothetical protein